VIATVVFPAPFTVFLVLLFKIKYHPGKLVFFLNQGIFNMEALFIIVVFKGVLSKINKPNKNKLLGNKKH